jgi:hypothetical protein
VTEDEQSNINKKDFPNPLKFLHYMHKILGPVCIDEHCEIKGVQDPHCHDKAQRHYD